MRFVEGLGKDEVEVSQLQFANDTLIFLPKVGRNVANYETILSCYEIVLLLKINYMK